MKKNPRVCDCCAENYGPGAPDPTVRVVRVASYLRADGGPTQRFRLCEECRRSLGLPIAADRRMVR